MQRRILFIVVVGLLARRSADGAVGPAGPPGVQGLAGLTGVVSGWRSLDPTGGVL
jgi:hypothetical protein